MTPKGHIRVRHFLVWRPQAEVINIVSFDCFLFNGVNVAVNVESVLLFQEW